LIAGVVLLLALGTLGSVFGARAIARNEAQTAHQAFVNSSEQVAATLKLAIEREQDLGVNAGAFIIGNPSASEVQFQGWVRSAQLFRRYPELQGIGEVVLVPASGLKAFAAAHGGSAFQVSPAGFRANYCFTTLTQGRTGQSVVPAEADVCATNLGTALLAGRDSGQLAYVPYGSGKNAALAVGTAVYQNGVEAKTVSARRASFVGWVGIQVLPRILLATALHGHPNTAVVFHYRSGSSVATFSSGTIPKSAVSTSIDLHNGWNVQVFSFVDGSSVTSNKDALALLIGGILVSLLLGALIYTLGTGRSRAIDLVRTRTEQLHHQALHDSLTGLANRALILDRINRLLARGRREHVRIGVLFLDLDNFKDINDTLGHRAGDELLVAVGERLTGALRGSDTVGRLGGDEFVIVTDGASATAIVEVVADRIIEALAAPFEIEATDGPLSVTASIGVAVGDRSTPEELLQDADIALYEAKLAGKKRSVTFSQPMKEALDEQRQLEVDLHHALEANQFYLVYQPTVSLVSGEIIGVEALIRWSHPTRGVVMPDVFIPTLESSGLIAAVGAWVLDEACRQGVAWHRDGHHLYISVNVSARQIERDQFVDEVLGAVSNNGLDPAMLVLELTETTLMINADATIGRLRHLKTSGVRIAIDDFGTGYSSLAYLRRFPIDILKIDRSFVSGMTNSPEAAAIVHALVQLGKALALETIAEGIETDDQRVRLIAEDIDNGQGYLFARPMEVSALDSRLQATRDQTASPGAFGSQQKAAG
jgi:diguanylate cyclase (GGDEF)-like protein